MKISATIFVLGLLSYLLCVVFDRARASEDVSLPFAICGILSFAAVVGGLAAYMICNIWGIA